MNDKDLTVEQLKSLSAEDSFKNFTKSCTPTTKEMFFEIIKQFYSVTVNDDELTLDVWPRMNFQSEFVYFHLCVNVKESLVKLMGYMILTPQNEFNYFADKVLLDKHKRNFN